MITNSAYYVISVSKAHFSDVGISYTFIIIAGLLWVIVPMLASTYPYSRRD